MTNQLFSPGREGFLDGSLDWNTATIKCSLLRGYSFNSTHKFLSDVTGASGVLVATAILTTPTVTGGVASADPVTFTSVATGVACNALLIYQSSAPTGGADLATTAQRLIAFIDTATNLPVTPNGGNINIAWDTGTNKIFTL
jgi:hypothetical protein